MPRSTTPTNEGNSAGARLALAVMGLIFLVYLPVAVSSYMFHDDYLLLFDLSGSPPRQDPHYLGMIACGRPISAEILFVVLKQYVPFFPTLTFFTLLRILNALSLAVSAGLFFVWLGRIGGNRVFAVAVTILLFTLPGFQVFASTAVSASHLPVMPLIFLALLVLHRAGGPAGLGDVFSRRQLLFTGLAAILLLISFFTYQATTFLFIACAPVVFLCSPQPFSERRSAFLQHVGVFAVAGAVHVAIGVLMLHPLVHHWIGDTANPEAREMSLHGVARVSQNVNAFVSVVWLRALNLWVVRDQFGSAWWAFWLAILSVAAFLAWTCWQNRGQVLTRRVGQVVEVLAYLGFTLAAANAVQLLYEPTPNYRVLLPCSVFVVCLLCWPGALILSNLHRPLVRRLAGGVVAGSALLAAGLAQRNTLQLFAELQIAEFATVRAAMGPFVEGKVRTVEFTSRPRGNMLVFGDEFSRLSSQSGNVLYGMVMRAYAENEGRWGGYLQEQLIITQWDSSGGDANKSGDPPRIVNQAAPTTAGTLQIDLDAVLSPLREAGTIRASRALARR